MSKDLDDLVSLYEIVSEQMNPFVGLSKVTKKRLDALENFTREIDTLKERTAELESYAERTGVTLKDFSLKKKNDEIDSLEKPKLEESENVVEDDVSTIEENKDELAINAEVDWSRFSDKELDSIIEQTLGGISAESRVDMIIDEFIENLKG